MTRDPHGGLGPLRPQVRFEEFWAEAKLIKEVLLGKDGDELEALLKKLYDFEPVA